MYVSLASMTSVEAPSTSISRQTSKYGFALDEVSNPNVEDARVPHTSVTSIWADGTYGPLLMVLPPGHWAATKLRRDV